MMAVAVAMRVAIENELVSEAKGLQIFTDSEVRVFALGRNFMNSFLLFNFLLTDMFVFN